MLVHLFITGTMVEAGMSARVTLCSGEKVMT